MLSLIPQVTKINRPDVSAVLSVNCLFPWLFLSFPGRAFKVFSWPVQDCFSLFSGMVQRKEGALDAAYVMNGMEDSEPSMPGMQHATAEVYIPSPWCL